MQRHTSRRVDGPTVAGRRFRLAFSFGRTRAEQASRRAAVAEHLDAWVPLRVISEQAAGRRCWLWIEAARPVSDKAARGFAGECPGYVPKSFKMFGD
jgi:hypothetical protein